MERETTETGLIILNCERNQAVDLSGGPWHGWVFYRHPDGQFVSERKLTPQELFVAELWAAA